jgi:hypothetical protein
MKHILIFAFLFCGVVAFAQTPIFTAGISYTKVPPEYLPGRAGSRWVIDTTTYNLWQYQSGTTWSLVGKSIQEVTGCVKPNYTPTKHDSPIVISMDCDSIWRYRGGDWYCVNCGDGWGGQAVVTDFTLTGNGTADLPLGIAQNGAAIDQVLTWDGTGWFPQDLPPSTPTASNGVSVVGNELQLGTLTGGTGFAFTAARKIDLGTFSLSFRNGSAAFGFTSNPTYATLLARSSSGKPATSFESYDAGQQALLITTGAGAGEGIYFNHAGSSHAVYTEFTTNSNVHGFWIDKTGTGTTAMLRMRDRSTSGNGAPAFQFERLRTASNTGIHIVGSFSVGPDNVFPGTAPASGFGGVITFATKTTSQSSRMAGGIQFIYDDAPGDFNSLGIFAGTNTAAQQLRLITARGANEQRVLIFSEVAGKSGLQFGNISSATTAVSSGKTLTVDAAGVATVGYFKPQEDIQTLTASTATVTAAIALSATASDVWVHLQGVRYLPTVDYTISGNVITPVSGTFFQSSLAACSGGSPCVVIINDFNPN